MSSSQRQGCNVVQTYRIAVCGALYPFMQRIRAGRTEGVIKEFMTQKFPKFDLTTDAEYVANLVIE